jgi:hypothetical protein
MTLIKVDPQEAVERLNERLSELIKKGEAIKVSDAKSCLEAKMYEVEVKSYYSAVDEYANPDINDADERLKRLRAAKKMLLAPLDAVLATVKGIRKYWEEQERVASEKEQAKADKKGGEPITIRPSIPTLQGTQSRRQYKVAVENADLVLQAYIDARKARKTYRVMFLRQFIVVDEAAVSAAARSEKGWRELKEQNVPGLKLWTE